MIIILDDILSVEECNHLISIHQQNKDLWNVHEPGGLAYILLDKAIKQHKNEFDIYVNKISNVVTNIINDIKIEWSEIVCRPQNSYQNIHIDDASQDSILTSITYLNNDYRGGETIFSDGTSIAPKIGRTVIFDGLKHYHGVNSISNNDRYIMPIWYKK